MDDKDTGIAHYFVDLDLSRSKPRSAKGGRHPHQGESDLIRDYCTDRRRHSGGGWRFGFAPHVVCWMNKTVAMAYYMNPCVAAAKQISEVDHKVEILPHPISEVVELVQKFLEHFYLKNNYKIEISNPTDQSGQVSPIVVLVSVWKCLEAVENNIGDKWNLRNLLFEMMNINVPAREAILQATLEGSEEHFHLHDHTGNRIPKRVNSLPFIQNRVLALIRVEESSKKPKAANNLIELIEQNLLHPEDDGWLGKKMTEEWEKSVIENVGQKPNFGSGLKKYKEGPGKEILKGYEIHEQGALVMMEKKAWDNYENIKEIAVTIAQNAGVPIPKITFDILNPARGAFSKDDVGEKLRKNQLFQGDSPSSSGAMEKGKSFSYFTHPPVRIIQVNDVSYAHLPGEVEKTDDQIVLGLISTDFRPIIEPVNDRVPFIRHKNIICPHEINKKNWFVDDDLRYWYESRDANKTSYVNQHGRFVVENVNTGKRYTIESFGIAKDGSLDVQLPQIPTYGRFQFDRIVPELELDFVLPRARAEHEMPPAGENERKRKQNMMKVTGMFHDKFSKRFDENEDTDQDE